MRNLFILLLLGAMACGDDSSPPANNTANSNNISDSNNASNNQNNTNNTNNPTNTATTNNPDVLDVDVVEVEPNDDSASATPLEVGQSFGGNIAAGAGENADIDFFSLQLEAGQIIEVAFDSSENIEAELVIFDAEENVVRYLTESVLTSRQFYVPISGEYFIGVYDVREDQQHGGDSAIYTLTTRSVDLAGEAISVPGNATGNFENGAVNVYLVEGEVQDVAVFETFGMREPGQGVVDTVLAVYSPELGPLDFNDDIDPDAEIYDSEVYFRADGASSYYVIVDAWDVGPETGYSLQSSTTDDTISIPSPISLDTPFSGVISAAEGDEFDTDFFVVELGAGEVARFEVSAADSDMEPTISVYINSIFGFFSIADALPVGDLAAVEFGNSIEGPGTYFVLVDDVRNVPFEGDGQNVGGETFTYTASLSLTTWSADAVNGEATNQGASIRLGTYDWYEFTIPAQTNAMATIESLIDDAQNSDPIFAVYSGGVEEAYDNQLALFNEGPDPQIVIVGVRDRYFRGTPDWEITFNMSWVTTPETSVDEVEPNDTLGTAQVVSGQGRVAASTQGTNLEDLNEDWFHVQGATSGTDYLIWTREVAGQAPADTIIEIYNAEGELLADNDDYPGQEETYFSGLSFEAAGDFWVRVIPYCTNSSCANGQYELAINE